MKLWKKILVLTCAAAAAGSALTACQELDIPPKNIMTNEKIFTPEGIAAYMASLYSRLPMEDFNVSADRDKQGGYFNWLVMTNPMGSTGEFANLNTVSPAYADKGYWKDGYQVIRQANVLIQDLPAYVGKLSGAEEWIAEARFIRAYTYFALVKRYGGVPILKEPQSLSDDGGVSLAVARNSHKECVDFMLEDLDYAIANMTKNKVNGRGNQYVAAAFKTRVALHAGSVARYGGPNGSSEGYEYFGKNGVQLCGIPAAEANGYFQQAFDAALKVEEGRYALVNGANKRQAFYDAFDKATSSNESVFIREYSLANYNHSWDILMAPERMLSTYGNRYFAPLDWVELFDGLPKDPATGYLKTTDDAGNYIVYHGGHEEFWKNAEPRLKASIMIPGETYKQKQLDMRAGLIIPSIDTATKIKKMVIDDGEMLYSSFSAKDGIQVGGKSVVRATSSSPLNGDTMMVNGVGIIINGLDGPATPGRPMCITGIYGVKWLNRTSSSGETYLHKSTQPWIDIRYAEVLLNRAEAAVELAQNGVSTHSGKDMLQDAFDCINTVRERAGANLLTTSAELGDMAKPENQFGTGLYSWVHAPSVGLRIVRVERYKELAVEHKLYWDIRRWFTAFDQMRNMHWRMLAPYLFASTAEPTNVDGIPKGAYIYDTRTCETHNDEKKFEYKHYYEKIPDVERKTNHLLEQNAHLW